MTTDHKLPYTKKNAPFNTNTGTSNDTHFTNDMNVILTHNIHTSTGTRTNHIPNTITNACTGTSASANATTKIQNLTITLFLNEY